MGDFPDVAVEDRITLAKFAFVCLLVLPYVVISDLVSWCVLL